MMRVVVRVAYLDENGGNTEQRVMISGLGRFLDVSAKDLTSRATLRYGIAQELRAVSACPSSLTERPDLRRCPMPGPAACRAAQRPADQRRVAVVAGSPNGCIASARASWGGGGIARGGVMVGSDCTRILPSRPTGRVGKPWRLKPVPRGTGHVTAQRAAS